MIACCDHTESESLVCHISTRTERYKSTKEPMYEAWKKSAYMRFDIECDCQHHKNQNQLCLGQFAAMGCHFCWTAWADYYADQQSKVPNNQLTVMWDFALFAMLTL